MSFTLESPASSTFWSVGASSTLIATPSTSSLTSTSEATPLQPPMETAIKSLGSLEIVAIVVAGLIFLVALLWWINSVVVRKHSMDTQSLHWNNSVLEPSIDHQSKPKELPQPTTRIDSLGRLSERRAVDPKTIEEHFPIPAWTDSFSDQNIILQNQQFASSAAIKGRKKSSFRKKPVINTRVNLDFETERERSGNDISIYDAYGSSPSTSVDSSKSSIIELGDFITSSSILPNVIVVPSSPTPNDSSDGFNIREIDESPLKFSDANFSDSSDEDDSDAEDTDVYYSLKSLGGLSVFTSPAFNTIPVSPSPGRRHLSTLISQSLAKDAPEYTATKKYIARKKKELSLNVGDVVAVVEIFQNDKGYGVNRTTGQVGLFPIICLVEGTLS